MAAFQPKDRFSKRIELDEREISGFAASAGDSNPLHHDSAFARARGFATVVASGPQTSALLMGMVASHFETHGPMLGLEFSFVFKGGVPANTVLKLEWMIIRVQAKPRHRAQLVELRGRLQTAAGVTAIGAKGVVLVYERGAA